MTLSSRHAGIEYFILAIGVILIVHGVVRHTLVCVFGLIFRDRLLIWWLCYTCCCLGRAFLQEFGWALCGVYVESISRER